MTDVAELIVRLRAVESASPDFLGDDEGRCVTCYHRNPDGPEAASTIEALSERITAQDKEREEIYAALRWVYKHGLVLKRPQWVSDAFNEAFASERIARASLTPGLSQ